MAQYGIATQLTISDTATTPSAYWSPCDFCIENIYHSELWTWRELKRSAFPKLLQKTIDLTRLKEKRSLWPCKVLDFDRTTMFHVKHLPSGTRSQEITPLNWQPIS